MKEVTLSHLHAYFKYSPSTGQVTWKKKRPGRASKVGAEAGTVSTHRPGCPYRALTLFHKKLYAHRVAWMLTYGDIPEGLCIDHIDGDGLNNRLENLRAATLSDNQRNSRAPRRSSSGHMSIHRHKGGLMVQVAGKYIGFFQNINEAVQARDKAQQEMGFHPNHGRKAA